MTNAFESIAEIVGAPKPEVIRGRSYPRRFNISRLSEKTMLKICTLSLIDFCCLNYELPPECLIESIPAGSRPRCKWTTKIQSGLLGRYIIPTLIQLDPYCDVNMYKFLSYKKLFQTIIPATIIQVSQKCLEIDLFTQQLTLRVSMLLMEFEQVDILKCRQQTLQATYYWIFLLQLSGF